MTTGRPRSGHASRLRPGALLLLAAVVLSHAEGLADPPPAHPWLPDRVATEPVELRIPPPPGAERLPLPPDSFGSWLRRLPLKRGNPPVMLFDGRPKANQQAHAAVLDLDVGPRDLQQCADAAIRLRAEYLFSLGRPDAIHFDFTSGDRADFSRWSRGDRPVVQGSRVRWVSRAARADASYASFRRYLDVVFTYAGSYSLGRELRSVASTRQMQPGDVLVEGGFPGHVVTVLDMAEERGTGRRYFLLAQGYMPAQEIHLLRNPGDPGLSPWYRLDDFVERLVTPEWTFRPEHLKRWGD